MSPGFCGLGRRCCLTFEFFKGCRLPSQMFLPHFGSERSDALVGTNGKEKVIAAFHHPHQHLLYQAVVRIDQHVVCLEAIEVKNELPLHLPIMLETCSCST